MDENMDDSMQLEGEIDFSAPTPPHEAASADMFGSPAPEVEQDTFPQSPAPSIDFSVATVDSPKNRPLPSLDGDNEHDQFDFDDSLDLFSVEGKKHELLSDMSEDEGKKLKERKHKKERKEKKHRKKESSPKETEEKVVKSTVSEEIEVVKKLESGPTKAELARRSLIELDEDEMEERVERRNRAALDVISKATGLTRLERRQKIVECRTYLKPIWSAKGDLAEFLETAVDKHNNRVYLNQDPLVKVLKYLEKSSYSDDESDTEKGEEEGKGKDKGEAEEAPASAAVNAAAEEVKGSFIELSDSEDEGEEEELEVAAAAPVAPAAPVLSAAELAAQQRAVQVERLKAAAEEKERAELERRRLRYEAAQKVQRSSRSELLTSLRQKVTVAAKENYCSQSKVKAEDLPQRLKITDTSRLLVELLKEQQEERNQTAREKRRAKFQNVANDDEEEFDSEAEEEALEEGKYLTAAERAALLQGDDDEEEEDQSSIEDEDMDVEMEVDGDGELAPVDEERQGLREVIDREKTVLEAVSDDSENESDGDNADEEDGEESSQVDTQMDTQLDTQGPTQGPGSDEEEDEEVRVQRSKRSSRPSQGVTQGGAASPVVQSGGAKTKYGRVRLGVEPSEEDDDLLLLDEQDQAQTGPTQLETQLTAGDENASVRADAAADEEEASLMGETVATKSKAKKSRSTGNALYRLALEEEERRHRTRKGNNLMDDEAAEEEEEGLQAGLGDFGFGVTSNIREHDEEMNALKVRKGDFDNIVDDLSDDEGDEAAGAAARAEMELLEDRARDRAIITAVTEGHDAMRSRAKKGAFSFDKLVGDNALLADKRRRKQGEDGGAEGAPEEEEEFDEEELMQRGMQNRTDRERLSRARRGGNAGDSDYDSDSSAPSDGDEDMFELLDTSGMTEEEKVAEMERVQSLREKNRQDALMAKQRIQSYKMARERARQEKIRRQQLEQSQSQGQSSQGLYHTSSMSSSSNPPGLGRQGSMGGAPRMARSLTLQPLEDEYSRLLMLQRAESVSQPQLAAPSASASSSGSSGVGSGSNLMPPPTISPRGVVSGAGGVDGKLADITNVPQQQIKRRTTLVPKQATSNDKRTMRRTQSSIPSTTAPSATAGPQSNLYKGELNKKDVQEGYGMGMAVKAQKVDILGGIFSAVTGIRRIGDLAATKPHSFTTLKKRTFSEAGKLGSTVAAQQFVFGAADEGSRMDSNSGFGSRSASVQGLQGVKRPAGSAFQIPGGSLFAQLGAKRGRT